MTGATIVRTGDLNEDDYNRAIGLMIRNNRGSGSFLQREMGLAYNAAAKLIERAEADGFLSKPDMFGKRHVTVSLLTTEAAAENRLIVSFMMDCNAVGVAAAAENLVRGLKSEAAWRRRSEVKQ